jgi:hypothetical protein
MTCAVDAGGREDVLAPTLVTAGVVVVVSVE